MTPPSSRFESLRGDAELTLFPAISFAFQPIVDIKTKSVVAYEALVRGTANQSAASIFEQVAAENLPRFDQHCRSVAITLAQKLELPCKLNLNMIPNGSTTPQQSIRYTVEAAERTNLPLERIVLEVAEGEVIEDHDRFTRITNHYRSLGFKLAVDDFGAGHAGLNLLADFQPDQLKLDKQLVWDIASKGPRQVIVRAIIQICYDLGIDLVAEGIETPEQYQWLANEGISLFQGYLLACPGFECFPPIAYETLPQIV